jgi:Domain of unknown function (DUF5914)/Rieske [2Fe-2S] domain
LTAVKRDATSPDWQRAHGPSIQRALHHAQHKPHGGWFVLGASRALRSRRRKPQAHCVDGVELVSWLSDGRVAAAPAACPHLGAHLADGRVDDAGLLRCPWHGLALPGSPATRVDGQGRWSALPVHDDGVLTWVQLEPFADTALAAPMLTKRPDRFFDAVIRRDLVAEPADVIANRLDPWHGVHFHPYAFAHLEVLDATDEALDLRVGYRVTPRHVIEVEARFDCPDPRTIVMTITAGEGTGSVVETHATPIVRAAPGVSPRTAMIEATLATSDRPGFATMLRGAAVARPIIAAMAARLWRDDARYAERTYALRARGWRPGDR